MVEHEVGEEAHDRAHALDLGAVGLVEAGDESQYEEVAALHRAGDSEGRAPRHSAAHSTAPTKGTHCKSAPSPRPEGRSNNGE